MGTFESEYARFSIEQHKEKNIDVVFGELKNIFD